ncbi:MAG: AAA family ATPase [Magnetococcales bacterium]|nr:AAA family ATPase [Magnetococcales bacterium]
MYLDHFGFHAQPFAITPDTGLFFAGGERGATLDRLLHAIQTGEGFIKVVGEVGSGKTMLCRLLCRKLPQSTRIALLLNPAIPPEELIATLLREFRLPPMIESGEAARHQALLEFLVTLERQGERATILIEEAQSLPPATLEALRLISNLETEQVKLISIVLFGQPSLDPLLKQGGSRQILERITTHLTLPPLSREETKDYLHSRVHASGYRGPELFSPGSVRRIHRASHGSLRQINRLAEKALIHASTLGAHVISSRHVRQEFFPWALATRLASWHRPALAAGGMIALLAGSMSLHSWALNMPEGSSPLADSRPAISAPANRNPLPLPEPLTTLPKTGIEPLDLNATWLTLTRTLSTLPQRPSFASPEAMPLTTATTISSRPLSRVALLKQPKPEPRVNASLPLRQKTASPLEPVHVTAALVSSHPIAGVVLPKADPRERSAVSADPAEEADPIRERVHAAHRWLAASQSSRYTIQLIHLRNDQGILRLDRALASAQPDLHAKNLKVFRLRDQKLMVYLGEFQSETEAQEAIRRLPSELRSGNPRVMPMERVKTLVRDHSQPDGCQPGQENGTCAPTA